MSFIALIQRPYIINYVGLVPPIFFLSKLGKAVSIIKTMMPSGQFSAELDSQTEVNYLVNLNSDKVYNIHLLHDEKLCVMRNCDEDGNLLDLRQSKVKFSLKKPWCLLHIKTYKIEGINVDVPVCSHCSPELLTSVHIIII